MFVRWTLRLALMAAAALGSLSAAPVASATPPNGTGSAQTTVPAPIVDRTEPPPKQLQSVGVTERLGRTLPRTLSFLDESGRPVVLGDYLGRGAPVIFTLNYSNCPMLCSLQLTGFVEALKNLDWVAGEQFEIVTVSLDPKERPDTARRTKHRYIARYGKPEAARGWHFLTGSEKNIRALADALGFHYTYDEKRGEYAHAAAIALASPQGTVTRYLYGIEIHPRTLRLSLVESSQGKVGSALDRLILYCFHYDETEGRYAPMALNIMRVGGAVAVVALGGLLTTFWMAELRKRRRIPLKST